MWFRSVIDSLQTRSTRRPVRQPSQTSARSRFLARHVSIEPFEDRRMLSFSPAASYLAGVYPQAIVSADFNSDGRLDLATADPGSSNVSIMLGNPDGTFQAAQISPTGATPLSLAVGDFNADGKLDLATANVADVSVLLGNGDGTFQAPTSIGVGSSPTSVAVGDFNSDGKLDLGVTSNFYYPGSYGYYGWYPGSYAGYANVLLGTGTGSFAAPITTWLGPGYFSSATVGQFNADGNQDFVAANSDYWTVSVLWGDGAGNLAGGGSFAIGASPWSVTAGDVNGDLATDLVTANNYNSSVSVFLGNGAGAFATVQSYAVGSYLSSVVLGDFDNDTTLDIAMANVAGNSVSLLRGLGDGTFAPPEDFPTGPGPYGVATGDFNGDGWLDVATANISNDTVSVLLNDGNWSLPSPPPPAVSVSDVTVTEGNTGTRAATFTVNLSAAAAGPVTVAYASADGSATLAGSDYQATSGSLSFAPGETSKTITLLVKGDRTAESDETFLVNLSGASGATIADGQGMGTIVDDEPRVSISDVTKNEGNFGTTPFVFTVSLSAAYDAPVTVKYATANGSATANGDYQATSGSLTFAAGQTSKTVTVQVKGDGAAEPDETFFVNLSNANGATIEDGQGAGTILNDDYEPRISVGDVTRSEGNSGTTRFVFTVNLSAASDSRVTVDYATANGTARRGDNDYVAKSGRLTFAPGQTSTTVTVSVKGDKKQEADETFFLNLGNAKGALIDDSQGLATILNDDGLARGRNQLAFAAAVDTAFEDWMTPGRRKSGR